MLAASGSMQPAPGFKVRLDPVREARRWPATAGDAPYVMGDDPEHMNLDAVIAARPLHRAVDPRRRRDAGYLYLVLPPAEPAGGPLEVCAAACGARR